MGKYYKQHKDENFERWWFEQKKIKKNMKKVCSEYGSEIETTILKYGVGIKETRNMTEYYDKTHNLFNCWNAKVNERLVDTFS